MGAIDDATSKIVYLRFWPNECLAGYLMMLRGIAKQYGLPEVLYHDKHTILKSPKPPTIQDELAGKTPMSQFQTVLKLLGVQATAANTAQAKGRVERLWKTLQDRLQKEMRVAKIDSLQQANDFLPAFINAFNQEFAIPAADPTPAWVELPDPFDFAYYFAVRQTRTVKPDHTICYEGRTLKIQRKALDPSLAGKQVSVHQDPEGELFIYCNKARLRFHDVAKRGQEQPRQRAHPSPLPPEQGRRSRRNQMAYLHSAVA